MFVLFIDHVENEDVDRGLGVERKSDESNGMEIKNEERIYIIIMFRFNRYHEI